jgi:streptogramin lyase
MTLRRCLGNDCARNRRRENMRSTGALERASACAWLARGWDAALPLVCLTVLVLVMLMDAQPAPADLVGQVTEVSTGLNQGSLPTNIAPGADGNLWFTDDGNTRARRLKSSDS